MSDTREVPKAHTEVLQDRTFVVEGITVREIVMQWGDQFKLIWVRHPLKWLRVQVPKTSVLEAPVEFVTVKNPIVHKTFDALGGVDEEVSRNRVREAFLNYWRNPSDDKIEDAQFSEPEAKTPQQTRDDLQGLIDSVTPMDRETLELMSQRMKKADQDIMGME